MDLSEFTLEGNPVCDPAAVITGEYFRISMLTTALVRFEYSENGSFEDRATQMVCNRRFAVPEFKIAESDKELHIYTKDLEIHYDKEKFSPGGLMVRVAGGRSSERVWHYGEQPRDLLGTARTLDEADGAIPLEHGIMSRNGYSLIDDSKTMVITEQGEVLTRTGNNEDFYFFGYGTRFLECLKDFYHLCGKTPLLPRYAFGNWWSRYHRYTESEYMELVSRFEAEEIPFSIAVVDMDWHLVDDVPAVYGSGWTGYTWNKKFFPDPERFMNWLHEHNMKITLNVHPADGIRAFEEPYAKVAKAMGIDPESKEPVLFDFTDSKFIETYFEELHHPMEKEGVDFWWLDWQQGTVTKIPGLDPLWMLNHYHYLDSSWKNKRRLTFSRYAGPGSHRYPVGFSGDTVITWESLQFQPYFTANASNIGFGWWSHDIGGHMFGYRDDELTARWVQLGVFSPINRLHSTDNPFNGKEPWKYNRMTEAVMKAYLKLRHSLVPYLYSMNRRASREDLPLIQPMYYLEPDREETYQVPNNYYFGSELMVSPITEKMDSEACVAGAKTWIPEGNWYDFFTGRKYSGGRLIKIWRDLDSYPVFAREGAIIPLKNMDIFDNSVENPENLLVKVFPGENGSFHLWEDQGDTPTDLDENWAETILTRKTENGRTIVTVETKGNLEVLPEKRNWNFLFMQSEDTELSVKADGVEIPFKKKWNSEIHGMEICVEQIPVKSGFTMEFNGQIRALPADFEGEVYQILEKAQIAYNLKSDALRVVEQLGTQAVASLMAMDMPQALRGALIEILTA